MRNYIEEAAPLVEEPQSFLDELSQETLVDLLNITESTVRLNRAGKLTSDQQTFVRTHMKSDDDSTWLLTTVFMGTALLLALIFILQGLPTMPFLLGGGIFAGSFALYTYMRRQNRERDLSVRVGRVTGDLRLVRSNSLNQWALVIGDKFFAISQTLAEKFDGYQPPYVAAYYTIGTNTLLSMEVLSTEKRKNDQRFQTDDSEVEEPLPSWEKRKNILEDPADTPAATSEKPEQEPEETATGSKRRF